MKQMFLSLVLLASTVAPLCAQTNKSDAAFQVPPDIIFNRKFMISLGNGNRMQMELSDISDLEPLSNIDSLLRVFLEDISQLKDSLADPLSAKRIDYITDIQNRKKIRFQQYQPKGASFFLDRGELASLRTEQDTINIIGIWVNPPKPVEKMSGNPRYYHLSFYLNDIAELSGYMHGILSGKIAAIKNNVYGKWPVVLGSGAHYMEKDKSITADMPRGQTMPGAGDFLVLNISVNIQNYKNYFVPSFTAGAKLTLTNPARNFKWEPGLFWEPHFIFNKDDKGKLQTYRNDFLTFMYGQGGTRDHDPRKDFSFSAVLSLGYLVRRQGDYFDKNTFRLGAGKLQLSKTAIEPSMYFNNFFRGVTPGIRLMQTF